MQAIVKWPGGKISEAPKILPLIPDYSGRFIDPFVGGGAIYFSANISRAAINDLSSELIALYRYIQQNDADFFSTLSELNRKRQSLTAVFRPAWDTFTALFDELVHNGAGSEATSVQIDRWTRANCDRFKLFVIDELAEEVLREEFTKNVRRKMLRLRQLWAKNGGLKARDVVRNFETAVHSAFYMYIRHLYNHASELGLSPEQFTACFYYLREFCYSSMFRFNAEGRFNVPYGGMAYNEKDFSQKIKRMRSQKYVDYLAKTEVYNLDFLGFLEEIQPAEDDFIFLDPPYDSDFSSYDRNKFTASDHERLAAYMARTRARYLMVIKNTDFVEKLYGNLPGTRISAFDKKYMVSFQNRNDKQTEHLIITNYLPVHITTMF